MHPGLDINERRGLGQHAAVLDQGRVSQVAETSAAKPAAEVFDGEPERCHLFDCAGNVSPAGSLPAKRACDHAKSASTISQSSGVQNAPSPDASSAALAARLGRAPVAHEQELGVERQRPGGHRDLQPGQHSRAEADLGAGRGDQGIDRLCRGYPVDGVDADGRSPASLL